jgi:Flp pilus assembly protein TadD
MFWRNDRRQCRGLMTPTLCLAPFFLAFCLAMATMLMLTVLPVNAYAWWFNGDNAPTSSTTTSKKPSLSTSNTAIEATPEGRVKRQAKQTLSANHKQTRQKKPLDNPVLSQRTLKLPAKLPGSKLPVTIPPATLSTPLVSPALPFGNSRLPMTGDAAVNTALPPTATDVPPSTKQKPQASASSTTSTTQTPATLPANTPDSPHIVAYNKGVELFQVAQGQAEKGNLGGQKALLQEAMQHFKRSTQLNPEWVTGYSNMGFVELTLGRYKSAVQYFEDALLHDPRHTNSLNGLATTLTLMGKLTEARAISDRLLAQAPDNTQYWFNRGCLEQKAGVFKAAESYYQKALSLTPTDQRVLFNLGTLAQAQGQWPLARQHFSQAKFNGIDTPVGIEAYRRLQQLPEETAPNGGSLAPVKP